MMGIQIMKTDVKMIVHLMYVEMVFHDDHEKHVMMEIQMIQMRVTHHEVFCEHHVHLLRVEM